MPKGTSIRKIVLVMALALLVAFALALFWTYRKMDLGYETDPEQSAHDLEKKIRKDVEFETFDRSWLTSSWANGFRDHNYLYRLVIPDEQRAALVAKFSKTASSASKARFLDWHPERPPEWWNAEAIDRGETYFLQVEERFWRLSVCEDALYLFISNG